MPRRNASTDSTLYCRATARPSSSTYDYFQGRNAACARCKSRTAFAGGCASPMRGDNVSVCAEERGSMAGANGSQEWREETVRVDDTDLIVVKGGTGKP